MNLQEVALDDWQEALAGRAFPPVISGKHPHGGEPVEVGGRLSSREEKQKLLQLKPETCLALLCCSQAPEAVEPFLPRHPRASPGCTRVAWRKYCSAFRSDHIGLDQRSRVPGGLRLTFRAEVNRVYSDSQSQFLRNVFTACVASSTPITNQDIFFRRLQRADEDSDEEHGREPRHRRPRERRQGSPSLGHHPEPVGHEHTEAHAGHVEDPLSHHEAHGEEEVGCGDEGPRAASPPGVSHHEDGPGRGVPVPQAVGGEQAQGAVERQRGQVAGVQGRLHQGDGAHGPVAAQLRGVEQQPGVHRQQVVEGQLPGGGGAYGRRVVKPTRGRGSQGSKNKADRGEMQTDHPTPTDPTQLNPTPHDPTQTSLCSTCEDAYASSALGATEQHEQSVGRGANWANRAICRSFLSRKLKFPNSSSRNA
ncbi:hypothetical protein EYF80_041357 [Liparis tanakae]|uniref:Uncharacterized protein n=1 Tax=Liparis tanakae TaxID=230148 RepID=A0A4Z2G5B6_9TELE|nr:hypothetical protein EYF80_041357 [Liparis tanakae]